MKFFSSLLNREGRQRFVSCTINQLGRDVQAPATGYGCPLPRTLAEFRGFHAGEAILVCGCGTSLNQVVSPERCITIGVNDVGRMFQPDYLVVLNPKDQFHGDRFRYVEESRAKAIFTQLKLGVRHPHIVQIRLGKFGGVDFSNPNCLHYTRNSPYLAMCLAIHVGAKRIGLIGVDFTNDHFFAHTGQHPLTRQFVQIDQEYKRLYDACCRQGIEVYNLSACSRLTALPRMSFEEFVSRERPKQSLNIVSYSTTPVAGVPAILARCIASRTGHNCRAIWATNSYSNGVAFEGDVEFQKTPAVAEELLQSADAVILHNGKVDARHRPLLHNKPVITMAHNYMWNVDTAFVRAGFPGVVVGQYQATLTEFHDWHVVPNPVPLWEPAFQPGEKGSRVTICYTPSGRHESYPANHRLYWHSKGYATTMNVLHSLARKFPVRLEIVGNRPITHAESLAMKRRAHIVIDECVTGSYHRNSLEGLACGCVVVNGVGLLPAIRNIFHSCARSASETPFVFADLNNLERVLVSLIESGSEALIAQGARNRAWMEVNWDFAQQWSRYWESVFARALEKTRPGAVSTPVSITPRTTRGKAMSNGDVVKQLKPGVSVVLCHGGQQRLPYLRASLANLRQCSGVNEVIVVDMGRAPYAAEAARRWADKYVFVRNGDVFERARCLNLGTAFAEYDLVLWRDNDLMLHPQFVSKAAAELRARALNFLVPYTCVHYLSETDSRYVMQGSRHPADCKPVKTLRAIREASGGAGLVMKSFVLRYGGMSEDFRGWGGEDTAWWFKARLLGSAGGTQRQDQAAHHLFHPDSGNYGGSGHIARNPYYAENVALLHQMCSIRDSSLFVRRFPPSDMQSRVWQGKRVLFLTPPGNDEAGQLAEVLQDLWAMQTECRAAVKGNFAESCLVSEAPPDSIVIFGMGLANSFLSDESLRPLWPKTVVAFDGGDLNKSAVHALARAGAVWSAAASTASALQEVGLRPWASAGSNGGSSTPFSTALALLQPLSIVLGGAAASDIAGRTAANPESMSAPRQEPEPTRLPVWMYWEGECPEWIRQCQKTVMAHAVDVRLLSPADFDQLWDRDLDINLQRLHVAHRADFVRAFLLARYGGLWVDSDCLVMQSLQPVLDALREHDFIAHRERSGYVANNFIAARRDSKIAAAFYRRICAILRSKKPLGWISIGGGPLTELLKTTDVPWHEIESELIEPIGWNEPAAFFAVDDDAGHERRFNSRAICYLLSNCEVQRFKAANSSQELLGKSTFFSYLLSKALDKNPVTPAKGEAEVSTARVQQIPFFVKTMVELAPRRVLEVGVGLGRWGTLIREFCEERNAHVYPGEWRVHLEGIQTLEKNIQDRHLPFYDSVHAATETNVVEFMNEGWELAIITGLPDSRENGRKILERALAIADYVLVDHSVATETARISGNGHRSLSDFLADDPVRFVLYDEPDGKSGSFLLSRNDPKGLKTSTPMEKIFARILEEYRPVGDESLSGPGSTLANTAEIRHALPLLVEDIGARSLLDAPCGDFNWMKQVTLRLERYIGVDILADVIEQNQKRYGQPARSFTHLDITRHPLPKADLILCRDCLTHFCYTDIFRALKNFKQSHSTYFLTTTYLDHKINSDIETGGWRPLNFSRPPFCFPAPLRLINEKCKENGGRYSDKFLGLWNLADVLVSFRG